MRALLEHRVLLLVDRVCGDHLRIEDDLVECKSTWPAATKAARQLAAHANTAGGESILWIIGLDEDAFTAPGAADKDLAAWWPTVRGGFDQMPPELTTHLSIPVGRGRSVVALEFATDRAPFVVTKGNASGRFERDVPWRAGTTTRSAHRQELLRILVPAARTPAVALVAAAITFEHEKAKESGSGYGTEGHREHLRLSLGGEIYFESAALGGAVVLPDHAMAGRLDFDPRGKRLDPPPTSPLAVVDIGNPYRIRRESSSVEPSHPEGVEHHRGSVYISGSGKMELLGYAEMDLAYESQLRRTKRLTLELELPIAASDKHAGGVFAFHRDRESQAPKWRCP